MNFDNCKWPVTSARCVLPGCECHGFKQGTSNLRNCDGCRHGWVAHVLAKLSPLPLASASHLEGLTTAIAYDVASMVLMGTHAIPVNLKILLDRLIPAHLQKDLNRILHDFGWTFQDYSRGYMLLDSLGQARDTWVTCRREEEPVILQQFLRFYDTRALAYEMLLIEATSTSSQSQRSPPGSHFPVNPSLDFRQIAAAAVAMTTPAKSSDLGGGPVASLLSSAPSVVESMAAAHLFPLMMSDAMTAGLKGLDSLPQLPIMPSMWRGGGGEHLMSGAESPVKSAGKPRRNTITAHFNEVKRYRPKKVAFSSKDHTDPRAQHHRLKKTAYPSSLGDEEHEGNLDNNNSVSKNEDTYESLDVDEDVDPSSEDTINGAADLRSESPSSEMGVLIEAGIPVHNAGMGTLNTGHQQMRGGHGEVGSSSIATFTTRNKKRVLCTTCNKSFCDKGALKIHYSAVHLREMHKCTIRECNMWFSSRRSRNRHSANPNPRLHMTHSTKKLPDNAVIVDDGTGRPMGERLPIPNSVLNPPIVSSVRQRHRQLLLTDLQQVPPPPATDEISEPVSPEGQTAYPSPSGSPASGHQTSPLCSRSVSMETESEQEGLGYGSEGDSRSQPINLVLSKTTVKDQEDHQENQVVTPSFRMDCSEVNELSGNIDDISKLALIKRNYSEMSDVMSASITAH